MDVIGEDIHIIWNGHNDDLFIYDSDKRESRLLEVYGSIEHEEGYSDNIIENRYEDEIKDFLSMVYGHTRPRYSLQDDKYTLKIIDEIERRIE